MGTIRIKPEASNNKKVYLWLDVSLISLLVVVPSCTNKDSDLGAILHPTSEMDGKWVSVEGTEDCIGTNPMSDVDGYVLTPKEVLRALPMLG